MNWLPTLDSIVTSVVTPAAAGVDRESRFPDASIRALADAGLLGLLSSLEVGGLGGTLADASQAVQRLASACGSTAMVVTMHYCATAVIEKYGKDSTRRGIAAGQHLSTLAFSESGSRSHFWAPVSSARADGERVLLSGAKTMVTSARTAHSYIWSSRPLTADGAASLWLVAADNPGLAQPKSFDGLGLRGNASAPITAERASVSHDDRLGDDGAGFAIMLNVVLPYFCVLNASCSLGIMQGALALASTHVGQTHFEHLGSSLADLPTIRAYLAKAQIRADSVKALLGDTLNALAAERDDAMLRVLEVKAAAAEAALDVTDTAMRVCGGAAFRKDLPLERQFRDARAASIMAPTSDVLYDFIGKAVCGLPLF